MRALWLGLLVACGGTPTETPKAPEAAKVPDAAPQKVVVYSGRSESLVGPLFKKAETALGITIEVQYGDTGEVVTRLATEGAASPADLIFAQEAGHLAALGRSGVLAKLPDAVLEQVGPRYKDEGGRWVGTSGRLRTLVYRADKLKPEDLPKSLAELADPKWKGRVGWAPDNGSFQAHVSLLRAAWGEEKTEAWLKSMKDNGTQRYPKNAPIVQAVEDGAIDLGWVNHYYLHQLKPAHAKNSSFATAGDPGNVLMVAGIAMREGAAHADAANKLVGWLVGPEAQGYFAHSTFEYPVRADVTLHPDVPPVAPELLYTGDLTPLSDLAPTRAMLQRVGLQ